MASEKSPVLFQARPHQGLTPTSPSNFDGRETWPLVHALAATLNTSTPLPDLAEVLGTYFGAKACLLLCHYPTAEGIAYSCWHSGGAPISYQTETADLYQIESGRVALKLIQQTADQAAGNACLHWQKGLVELLRQTNHCPPTWLRSVAACTAIAVDGDRLQGAILLLGAADLTVEQGVQANLASLGAIAFHQHFLQGQAQRHTEQLRYLNYLKEDFLSTLNHELRTPLTSMMLAIRMLRRPDLTPERTAMYLDILEQQCTREINLVNDLLMLQTLEAKPLAKVHQTVDVGQVLIDVAEQAKEPLQQAQLTLDWQLPLHPVMLHTDVERLTKVLRELLSNASKYSAPQTAITLALADNQAQHGQVTLQISNLGTAIEADDLPHIFEKFRRGRHATREGIAGTGTGLALVRGLLEQLGGTIKVSSQPCDAQLWQTCFTLEFERHDKSTHNS
ncbi:MAG TPA: HAMP domain-containing sensor histidine kinase [Nodosilinea sp.]|nr:HAMP domain-containing sensor histidine kinase [Nodosilinea sp.]